MEFKLEVNQSLRLALTTEMKLSLKILEMGLENLLKFLEEEKSKNNGIEIEYIGKNYRQEKKEMETIENIDIEVEKNLIDFLEEQLSYEKIESDLKKYINFFINNLDEKGYLIESKESLYKRIGGKRKDFNKALKIFQNFEPEGIGAENLVECLLIQSKKYNSNDLNVIIKNHLEDIAKNDIEKIFFETKIPKGEIEIYISYIKKLNPKPARGYFINNKNNYVVPDIFLKKKESELEIEINRENFPKIKISKEKLSKKEYLRIIAISKAIEKREETLSKVANYILNFQKESILKKYPLKTLKIKDVAYDLEIHESTVSRAIKDKYIKVEGGKIESLKNFIVFNSERERAKTLIYDIIDKEDRKKPISDEKLAFYLKKNGVEIQRRTVTKYREELGILSSRERKRRDFNE